MWTNRNDHDEPDEWKQNLTFTLRFLGAWLAAGVIVLCICAGTPFVHDPGRDGLTEGLTILCHGILLSMAFASVGGLVGFLFGIPRQVRQSDKKSEHSDEMKEAESDADGQQGSATNLEQVADWLTKIILGAGLTQLIKVPRDLKTLGIYFSPGFHDSALVPVLIVLASLTFGFFAGYLITQLFLAKALKVAADSAKTAKAVLRTAGNLEKVGQFGAASSTLEGALTTFLAGTPIETKRSVYEKLTYNALYEMPPDGFQKAIRFAEQYLREETGTPSAKVLVNLAAALGQKYKWDQDKDVPKAELDETRSRALDAASKAMKVEPRMKDLLRMLWNPNDPTKLGSEEDDLESFYDDPDFKKLLG
jgi:hypothetical protein